eukprot:3340453-Alexandrium_andersonii.AAC.1
MNRNALTWPLDTRVARAHCSLATQAENEPSHPTGSFSQETAAARERGTHKATRAAQEDLPA